MSSASVQPGLPKWASEFMGAVDSRDAAAIDVKLTDDVAFTIGNHPTVTRRDTSSSSLRPIGSLHPYEPSYVHS